MDSSSRSKKKTFRTEAGLVRHFVRCLKGSRSPWGTVRTVCEWTYDSGTTDVLARSPDGALIAFEAKLKDWRRACLQGYRNTGYADFVYIIVPEMLAIRLRAFAEYFSRHGVGLCYCTAEGVEVVLEAPTNQPVMAWLRDRALATFEEAKDGPSKRSLQHCGLDLRTAGR